MLALCIGTNVVMFSLVNGIVCRPLPVRDANRLVSSFTSNSSRGWPQAPVSVPDFRDWVAQSKGLRPIAAFQRRAVLLADRSARDVVPVAVTSAAIFTILGPSHSSDAASSTMMTVLVRHQSSAS
jgi:putative ABC transport system permease protein